MLQPSEEHWCIQELRDFLAGVIDCECDYLWRDPSCGALQLLLLPLCLEDQTFTVDWSVRNCYKHQQVRAWGHLARLVGTGTAK
jgi:hypothetical protein